MGMNPRGRSRGRNHNNYGNNRRFNNGPSRNTVYDSIGPAGRMRGTAFQLMEKYQSAAKELMSSDRVLAESCLQHADHYLRLNALAVAAENRFNPQSQPAAEISDAAESAETAAPAVQAETAQIVEQPVVVALVPPAAENAEPAGDLDEVAKMDLSVPVSVMVENEMKARRTRPAAKKAPVKKEAFGEGEPAPKRRGRPPAKKTADVDAV